MSRTRVCHRRVDEIGRRDLLDLIDGIADRGAVIMARRVQTHLHRFFKWCVGRGIIETSPAADLPKPGSETRRDRVLSDEELAAVWRGAEALGWPFGTTIRLLLLTGARRGGQGSEGDLGDDALLARRIREIYCEVAAMHREVAMNELAREEDPAIEESTKAP